MVDTVLLLFKTEWVISAELVVTVVILGKVLVGFVETIVLKMYEDPTLTVECFRGVALILCVAGFEVVTSMVDVVLPPETITIIPTITNTLQW